MSSKKAQRRARREKEQVEKQSGRRIGPVALFLVAIGVALLATVVSAVVFVDRPEAPYPGAVWSEAHGHWH